MSEDALEKRLTELEVRVSFQQQTIEDLDEVVREFTLEVDRLKAQLRDLRQAIAAGSNETVEEGTVD